MFNQEPSKHLDPQPAISRSIIDIPANSAWKLDTDHDLTPLLDQLGPLFFDIIDTTHILRRWNYGFRDFGLADVHKGRRIRGYVNRRMRGFITLISKYEARDLARAQTKLRCHFQQHNTQKDTTPALN